MIWDERDIRHGVVAAMNKRLTKLPIKRDGEVQPTPIPEERLGEVQTYEFDRAVPAWYQKLRGKPKPVTIYMRLILPETEEETRSSSETQADSEASPQ